MFVHAWKVWKKVNIGKVAPSNIKIFVAFQSPHSHQKMYLCAFTSVKGGAHLLVSTWVEKNPKVDENI